MTDTRIPLHLIVVEKRQRKEISDEKVEELAQSISRHTPKNLLHPIVVEPQGDRYRLIAGERRLRAFKHLAEWADEYKTIPARFISELTVNQRIILELEENIKRVDLDWKDEAEATLVYYEARNTPEALADDKATEYGTARLSGDLQVSTAQAQRILQVARKLREGDKQVAACTSIASAASIIHREFKRTVEADLLTFGEVELEHAPTVAETPLDLSKIMTEIEDEDRQTEIPAPKQTYSILLSAFENFVGEYSGAPFNFLHCDFPYEIGLDQSEQFNTAKLVNYDDSTVGIYLKCLDSLGKACHKGIISASCHMIFWFPMSKYSMTKDILEAGGWAVNPYPLVWFKSDKVGIIPDVTRYPRRIYETAFLCSRGDRKIIKALSNASYQPRGSRSSDHASYKPREVHLDFLPMFVEPGSRVLDPTCGSGSALGVCLELGASVVVGLDIVQASVDLALQACKAGLVRKS